MTILQKFRTSPSHIACVYMCSELMTMTILQSVEGLEGKSMGRVAQKIRKMHQKLPTLPWICL